VPETTFTPIRTERLVIRPWRTEEAPRLLDILRRPAIVKWLGHPKCLETVEEAEAKIAGMADDLPKSEWAFEVAEPDERTGVPAGSVMLVDIPHSEQPDGTKLVQIGWYAHPDALGHGYVTEAARAVLEYGLASGLDEIRALTHTDNHPSMRVCDRLGMTYLGVTEDWYDDAPSSHYIVRRGEWPVPA
jgi:RimJ/RimL family protein N-acetyltransferase